MTIRETPLDNAGAVLRHAGVAQQVAMSDAETIADLRAQLAVWVSVASDYDCRSPGELESMIRKGEEEIEALAVQLQKAKGAA